VPDVHFYQCDLADTPATEKLCGEIVRTHGDATVLVNNAGIGIGKTVLEASIPDVRTLLK
jgi:all-trans-retinol dehydrogenase (NAD+)